MLTERSIGGPHHEALKEERQLATVKRLRHLCAKGDLEVVAGERVDVNHPAENLLVKGAFRRFAFGAVRDRAGESEARVGQITQAHPEAAAWIASPFRVER